MSEYGCCTLWICIYDDCEDDEVEIRSCDECPHYDPYFFKEQGNEE